MMRKTVALFVLICVFFPLAISAMALTSIRPWVLDRSVYERMVSDERLYDALLVGELPNQFNRNVIIDADQLPLAALNIALREVVTTDYLRTQSLSVVNQAFDFIEGSSESFEISLDITSVKTALEGEAGVSFAKALAAALPPCELGQQAISPGGRLVRCLALDSSANVAAEQIAAALPLVLADTPDRLIINDPVNLASNWGFANWFRAGTVRGALDIAILTLIFTTLVAVIVGAYLGGDDHRQRLLWFGSALFVPASLFVLMGLIMVTPLIVAPLRIGLSSANWYGFQYSDAFWRAVTDMIFPLVQKIGSGFLITGVVSCLTAFGLLLWSWFSTATNPHASRMVQVPARNL